MGLHEDVLMVAEASAASGESSWFIESTRTARFRQMLKNVCLAFYRTKAMLDEAVNKGHSDDMAGRANRIEVEQRLAHMLVVYAEDKKNPPFNHNDGAYEIGARTFRSLAVELEARIGEIVRFRDVLARNLLEQREEYEKKLGDLRTHIADIEFSCGNYRDKLAEAAEQIRVKDEALTNAARKQPWRRVCESIHEPYSGKCQHCQPPSPQDLAEMQHDQTDLGASDDRPLGPDHTLYRS